MVRLYEKDGTEIRAIDTRELPPIWVKSAYNDFHRMMTNPEHAFPCYFGVIGENKGLLRYSFLEAQEVEKPYSLKEALVEYLASYRSIPGKSALIIFVGDGGHNSVEEYESTFWKVLQGLHDVDENSWPEHIPRDPEDSRWEYCLDGQPWFITGHSPSHHNRRSRYARSGLMMVMQPTANLHGIVGEGEVPEQIRKEIRGLLKKYDSIPESPDLWRAGDRTILEWKQYWFNDTNKPNLRKCPLQIRPKTLWENFPS